MDQQEAQRAEQTETVRAVADELRPAVQAVIEFTVAAARAVLAGPGDPDEVWAATVLNIGQSLGLDLDQPGQLTAAVAVTELVMQQAGAGR